MGQSIVFELEAHMAQVAELVRNLVGVYFLRGY